MREARKLEANKRKLPSTKRRVIGPSNGNGHAKECGAFHLCEPRFVALEQAHAADLAYHAETTNTLARIEGNVRALCLASGRDPDNPNKIENPEG
jgi:hypothetical protein